MAAGRAVIKPGAHADGKRSKKCGPAGSGVPWGGGQGLAEGWMVLLGITVVLSHENPAVV